MINNILLLGRDTIKQLSRLVEQLTYRLFYLEREPGTAVSITARLDIGPKLTNLKKKSHKLRLKSGTHIESGVIINTDHGDVNIGRNCAIGIGCIIIGPAEINDNVSLGPNVFICGENRKHSGTENGLLSSSEEVDVRPVTIGKGSWVGTSAIILPGVKIGSSNIVGAAAIVSKSSDDNQLIKGQGANASNISNT
jgi:acetyltransferase-like isoleucine patch superfamily enzyme